MGRSANLLFQVKPCIILFIINNSNQRTQFKKVGDADPEIIGTANDSGLKDHRYK